MPLLIRTINLQHLLGKAALPILHKEDRLHTQPGVPPARRLQKEQKGGLIRPLLDKAQPFRLQTGAPERLHCAGKPLRAQAAAEPPAPAELTRRGRRDLCKGAGPLVPRDGEALLRIFDARPLRLIGRVAGHQVEPARGM